LDFRVSRRAFFPALIREVRVLSATFQGEQTFALSELGDLPDAQLARLIPLVVAGFLFEEQEGRIWARHRERNLAIELCAADRPNRLTLDLFDGEHTLAAAGSLLAQQMGWQPAAGFSHVKALFLDLVGHLVCVPRNPLEPAE
jgi:hypothetical protein